MKIDAPYSNCHLNSSEPASKPNHRQRFRSWSLSLLTHLLLGILLVFFIFSKKDAPTEEGPRRGGIVLTTKNQNLPAKYLCEQDLLEEIQDAESETTESRSQISSGRLTDNFEDSLAKPPAIPIELPPMPDQPGFPMGFSSTHSLPAVLDADQMANVPPPGDQNSEYQLSIEDLAMIAADRQRFAAMKPVGDPTSISVFGSGKLTGRSFVFVLDRSKSMGGSGLGVIHAARSELTGAIKQLEPHHLFQIVGYHNRTVTMSSRKLLAANHDNQNRVFGYISGLAAFGGTEHERGLLAALAFQPDVIVLLTDGGEPGLHDGQLKLLRQMAGEKTEIHCLQFGFGSSKTTSNFMTKLAAQNRGQFRYVDVNQWNKEKR